MFQFVRKILQRTTNNWYPLSSVPEGFFCPNNKLAGAITSAQQALTLSPFWAAIRLYQNQISSFPLVTYKKMKGGGKEKATDNPAYNLLLTRPNPAQSNVVFWQYVIKELFLHGNAYVHIRFNGNREPIGLYPLPCHAVQRVVIDSEWNKFYYVNFGSGDEIYHDDEILNLMGFSNDGLIGEPIWKYASESLGLHRQVLESASQFFANSARPSLVVRYPGKMTKEGLETFKKGFKESFQGTANVGSVPVLTDDGNITQLIASTAEDMQLSQSLGTATNDVGKWFSVSEIDLGNFENSHYSTLVANRADFYQRAIRPVLFMIQQEINWKLFGTSDTFAEFDTDEILNGSPLDLAQLAQTLISAQIIDPDEAREWFGMSPRPEPITPPQAQNPTIPTPQEANVPTDNKAAV